MAEKEEARDVATRPAGQDVGPLRGFYSDEAALQRAFQGAMKGGNLLSPVVRIDHIPAMHSVSLRMVVLNPTPPDREGKGGGGDVYLPDTGRSDELALTKVALDKVAAAAGISWDPTQSGRMDNGADPYYARYRAVGWIVDFDGSRRCISAERELDLRDGSATAVAWQRKNWSRRLEMAREFIVPQCESKARNRAIRQALAIKSKYTAAEIARPFVVPKLVLDLDRIEDPDVRRAVAMRIADRSLGAVDQLYVPAEVPPAIEATPRNAALGKTPPPPIGSTQPEEDENGDASSNPDYKIPF